MTMAGNLWGDYASVLHKQFFQHALVAAVLIGVLCGVVGTYVVLRGYAFLGDALAHATFPGVAVAYLLGTSILGGALAAGFVTAFLIAGVSRSRRVSNDSAIGVLFAGAFALGVMLISRIRSYRKDLSSLLFGNVLGVSTADVVIICALGALILAVVLVCYRQLLLVSFDPVYAASLGYAVWALDLLLLGVLTLTIVVCLQVVGNVLVVAMILTPSAAARLLTDRVPAMMAIGAAIGAFSAVVGLFISYPAELAPGATIVIVATGIFFLALVFSPRQGYFTEWAARRHRIERPAPASREGTPADG